MEADGEVLSTDISGNELGKDAEYLDTLGVKKGWEHNANNKKNPGGSSDVVIAIIDTGVDYNHLDLIDNIWINTAEIPDNGIDDDNNGYIYNPDGIEEYKEYEYFPYSLAEFDNFK
jgi:subtilisin family serine protease